MKFGKKDSAQGTVSSMAKKKKKKKKIIIGVAAVLVVAGAATAYLLKKGGSGNEKQEIMTAMPTYGDIALSVTGSGTVAPYDRYEIVPLVTGEIIQCNYDVGDEVKEGDVLEIRFGEKVAKLRVLSVAETVRKNDAAAMYEMLEGEEM